MTNFEAFTAELQALRELAPAVLDDQRAPRFLSAAATAERLLVRCLASRTTERSANRATGVRRALTVLAHETKAPDAPAWVERREALLAHVERMTAACADIEAAMRAADEQITSIMRAAIAA